MDQHERNDLSNKQKKSEIIISKEIKCKERGSEESAVRRKYMELTHKLIEKKCTITIMESCTSGQIASLITDTEGASFVFKGSFVTYSNEAKIKMGVPAEIIEKYGVYSDETACAMAEAARSAFGADIALGVTGTFGNADPVNSDSIPGKVFFAFSTSIGTKSYHCDIPMKMSRLAYKLYIADIIADCLFLEVL